jgi:hypothetical protein
MSGSMSCPIVNPTPLAAWLTDHPEVTTVVRDGSTTYAEAVRRARPGAIQVSDR